jgi:hypothetical protein
VQPLSCLLGGRPRGEKKHGDSSRLLQESVNLSAGGGGRGGENLISRPLVLVEMLKSICPGWLVHNTNTFLEEACCCFLHKYHRAAIAAVAKRKWPFDVARHYPDMMDLTPPFHEKPFGCDATCERRFPLFLFPASKAPSQEVVPKKAHSGKNQMQKLRR